METKIRAPFTKETQNAKVVSRWKRPFHSLLGRKVLGLFGGLVAGLLLLAYPGCEQVVEIEWPDQEPQLVVNLFMEADSEIIAWVNRSQGIQDTGSVKAVTDATLVLRMDGAILDTLEHDSAGRYTSPLGHRAVAGHTYLIDASAPGLPSTSGSFSLPQAPVILNMSFRDSAFFESGGYYQSELTFELDDAPGALNYYTFSVFVTDTFTDFGDTLYQSYMFAPESDDPVIDFDVLSTGNMCEDAAFDGTRRTFRFKIGSDFHATVSRTQLVVGQCSESYFRYSQTMSSYMDASFNPFAEPVRVYSNMTAGMGIIGGVSKSWMDF